MSVTIDSGKREPIVWPSREEWAARTAAAVAEKENTPINDDAWEKELEWRRQIEELDRRGLK